MLMIVYTFYWFLSCCAYVCVCVYAGFVIEVLEALVLELCYGDYSTKTFCCCCWIVGKSSLLVSLFGAGLVASDCCASMSNACSDRTGRWFFRRD